MSTDRPQAQEVLAEHDFYRCYECRRLHTKPEIMEALGPGGTGVAPCGHKKISPANLPWWGWVLPRVLKFAYARIRGRV